MLEEWKDVNWLDGYQGILKVSSAGRVMRTAMTYETKNRWGPCLSSHPDKILSPYVERNGYPSVAIRVNKKRKRFLVHRLVARAFVPGYAPTLSVNHINGDKTDNRSENLEWVTFSRNTEHQWEIGLVNLRGDNHPSKKLTSGKVRIIRDLIRLGANCNQLAILADVSPSTIYFIRDGKRWSELIASYDAPQSDE